MNDIRTPIKGAGSGRPLRRDSLLYRRWRELIAWIDPHADKWLLVDPRRLSFPTEMILLFLLLLLAEVFRLSTLGADSLRTDEAYILEITRLPLKTLWSAPLDTRPPLYDTLVKIALAFGDNETALRSVSAVFGVLTMIPFYLLARWAIGEVGALTALAALAMSSSHLSYASYANSHGVLLFFFAVLYLALFKLTATLLRDSVARDLNTIGHATAYVAASIAALYTHNTAIFYILVANASMLAYVMIAYPRDIAKLFVHLTILNVPVIIAWLPWAVQLAGAVGPASESMHAATGDNGIALASTVGAGVLGGVPATIYVALTALGVIVGVIRRSAFSVATLCHLIAFPLAIWLAGHVRRPLDMTGVLLPAILGGAMSVGALAAFVKSPRLAGLMSSAALTLGLGSCLLYLGRDHVNIWRGSFLVQDWRQGVARAEYGHEAIILCSFYAYPSARFYSENSPVYVFHDDSLWRIGESDWLRLYGAPLSSRGGNFDHLFKSTVGRTEGARLDWTTVARTQEAVAVMHTDDTCITREDGVGLVEQLEQAGYRSAGTRWIPGVSTALFRQGPAVTTGRNPG